jgi:hypothetical protein
MARSKLILALLAILSGTAAYGQGSDVGLVTMVSGAVTFTSSSEIPTKAVKAFMKMNDGDRFSVAASGQVRLVFFEGSRQEYWVGPASFRVRNNGAEPIMRGPMQVSNLPVGVTQRLAQVPELLRMAKFAPLGGVTVRGESKRRRTSLEQQVAVGDARVIYEKLRHDSVAIDIAPELFFFAVLNEFQVYEEMKTLTEEMRRKQPGNEDVKVLAEWVRTLTTQ